MKREVDCFIRLRHGSPTRGPRQYL